MSNGIFGCSLKIQFGITFGDGPPMSESGDERPETRDGHRISTDDPMLDKSCSGKSSTWNAPWPLCLWWQLCCFLLFWMDGTWDTTLSTACTPIRTCDFVSAYSLKCIHFFGHAETILSSPFNLKYNYLNLSTKALKLPTPPPRIIPLVKTLQLFLFMRYIFV